MTHTQHVIYIITLGIAALLTTAFPLMYIWTRWWKTREGRAVLWSSTAFAVLIDQAFIVRAFQIDESVAFYWRVPVFAWGSFTAVYLSYSLMRAQHPDWRWPNLFRKRA